MLRLHRGHRRVVVVRGRQLLWRRLCGRSTGATVEADIGHVGVVDYSLVIDVCNVDAAEIVHCSVVGEHAAAPKAAGVANAGVAESVIDAAVEADAWTPIARVPDIDAIVPAPIARGPKQAHLG